MDLQTLNMELIDAVQANNLIKVTNLIKAGADATYHNNLPLRHAAEWGYIEILRLLLVNPRVAPSANNNQAIRYASSYGRPEVVEILLEDAQQNNRPLGYRVDPTVEDNRPIREAALFGHIKIVQLLLTDPRVDPTVENNTPIRSAITNYNKELVLLLFSRPGVAIPTIEYFIHHGDLTSLNKLAQMTGAWPKSETDPTISPGDLMVWGAAVGSLNLVQYLVGAHGVDPTFADNSAVVVAQDKGHDEIVQYLLTRPGVHL